MTNNKQQTAVEWLIEQFWNNEGMLTSKKLEKALEMEKEQTEQAKLDAKEIIIIKLTAVEWLMNEWPILNSELPQWLIEQAKEMEKEQIIDFAHKCSVSYKHEIERKYNETYGGNK